MTELRCGPLVRAVDATSAIVWAECFSPCILSLQVAPLPPSTGDGESVQARAVMVGGRHFVVLHIQNLQPSTWYTYTLAIKQAEDDFLPLPTLPLQCFRTLAESGTQPPEPLRVLYGSCRKLDQLDRDLLEALGRWLPLHFDERDDVWPHVQLLIGDQIYADDAPAALRVRYPRLRYKAQRFEDFALLYEYAWTYKPAVRQALALLPTFMIFDDHELVNNWNASSVWKAEALHRGLEQLLVDGLVAYWVYQGWGNFIAPEHEDHQLLKIMHEFQQSGEDALDSLRSCVRQYVYAEIPLPWHYTIATTPPIFVTNTRADRTSVLNNEPRSIYAPTEIMGQGQLTDLKDWLQVYHGQKVILVSSVPVLLPPLIGLAEHIMGLRLRISEASPFYALGHLLASFQLRLGLQSSFDHWPLFVTTWHRFVKLFKEHQEDIIVLSGDVHFSYAAAARRTLRRSRQSKLYQLVSSPIQNELEPENRRRIELQSFFTEASYGGLHTSILPLEVVGGKHDARRGILYENTLGYLTVNPDSDRGASIQHHYLGLIDGQIAVVGRTKRRSLQP